MKTLSEQDIDVLTENAYITHHDIQDPSGGAWVDADGKPVPKWVDLPTLQKVKWRQTVVSVLKGAGI